MILKKDEGQLCLLDAEWVAAVSHVGQFWTDGRLNRHDNVNYQTNNFYLGHFYLRSEHSFSHV